MSLGSIALRAEATDKLLLLQCAASATGTAHQQGTPALHIGTTHRHGTPANNKGWSGVGPPFVSKG
ncbi:hypothetical protein [Chitinophaga sp. sic0106]|uniref:hypothetical protein n=1 Tax=Chitinophaga sp. sic0106 TaxID=2854785 RepID=UPI001C436F21|nr:hypothetical protein [Chitinophaga sp. sic0106]MBV7529069.1 hypothetical protein [Chitinophaga sp. sic0106]